MSNRPAAMEVLRQEHANMTLLLDLLERQIAALRQHDGVDFVLIGGIVDYFLTYPDLMHHPKEDILFHRLQELDPAAAAEAEGLVSGHEALGLLARSLARAMVDHLLNETDESRLWLCSLGLGLRRCAGIVAARSQRCGWGHVVGISWDLEVRVVGHW